MHDDTALLAATNDKGDVLCGWFARCENVAVGVTVHPVLGLVPVCDRCADKCDLDVCRGKVELDTAEGVTS